MQVVEENGGKLQEIEAKLKDILKVEQNPKKSEGDSMDNWRKLKKSYNKLQEIEGSCREVATDNHIQAISYWSLHSGDYSIPECSSHKYVAKWRPHAA